RVLFRSVRVLAGSPRPVRWTKRTALMGTPRVRAKWSEPVSLLLRRSQSRTISKQAASAAFQVGLCRWLRPPSPHLERRGTGCLGRTFARWFARAQGRIARTMRLGIAAGLG